MRKHPTRVEHRVWTWLRGRRFLGMKFRRQVPMGVYVIDFYCQTLKLAIELDGWSHRPRTIRLRDIARSRWLARAGITVVRLQNDFVRTAPDRAADVLRHEVCVRFPVLAHLD
jgi:very-short-patch-repair endonuclease